MAIDLQHNAVDAGPQLRQQVLRRRELKRFGHREYADLDLRVVEVHPRGTGGNRGSAVAADFARRITAS